MTPQYQQISIQMKHSMRVFTSYSTWKVFKITGTTLRSNSYRGIVEVSHPKIVVKTSVKSVSQKVLPDGNGDRKLSPKTIDWQKWYGLTEGRSTENSK